MAANGFIQLAALPAGVYSLEVTRPGYVPTVESPLEVWEKKEVRLRDPIVLERPLTLDVVVTPPLDWLDRPWKLRLSRASRLTGTYDGMPVFDGPIDERGQARIPDQSAGIYTLQIIDSVGNPLFGELDREISGLGKAEIRIDLDLLVVRGTLTYQEEPVTASLWFGLRYGGIRSEMAADLEGNFSGVLPNPGWWIAEIDAPSIGVTGYWVQVEVEPDSRGEAEVEIALPDTEVTGRVVDGDGLPVAGAEVIVGTSRWGRETETDAEGAFRIAVLEPGPAGISASHRRAGVERTSDAQEILIDEEQPTPPVELVLRDRKAFQGRVFSERGPVPGALVAVGTIEPREAAGQQETRSDVEGRFSVDLPSKSQRLRAIVAPPGHALRAFDLSVADTLELAVPVIGGTVVLGLDLNVDPHSAREFEGWLLYQDGLALPDSVLRQWTRGHGMTWGAGTGELLIPQLAPGLYRLCRLPKGRFLGWEPPTPIACDEGFLSPGGRLRLELPRTSK
ncbi:MAG: carboxypeptidase-like regulatory domain-containing protein [Acidobacteriota bacterium]